MTAKKAPKKFGSYHQIKSGIWVREDFCEERNRLHQLEDLFIRNWYRLDESIRTTVVTTVTKSMILTASATALLAFDMAFNNFSVTDTKARNENDDMQSGTKRMEDALEQYRKENDEVVRKLMMDVPALTVIAQLWSFNLIQMPKEHSQINLKNVPNCSEIDGAGTILKSLGKTFTYSELRTMMNTNTFDADRSGPMSFLTSLYLPENRFEDSNLKELRSTFDFLDKDKDGYITTSELCEALASVREDGKQQALKVDGDGHVRISFELFKLMMPSK